MLFPSPHYPKEVAYILANEKLFLRLENPLNNQLKILELHINILLVRCDKQKLLHHSAKFATLLHDTPIMERLYVNHVRSSSDAMLNLVK